MTYMQTRKSSLALTNIANDVINHTNNAISDELIRVAGLIVMSDNPCQQIKFWREKFGISQSLLVKEMGVTLQTLWQYETCHRKMPGALFVRRFVLAIDALAKRETITS
jgi:predicted transcriptional regulator